MREENGYLCVLMSQPFGAMGWSMKYDRCIFMLIFEIEMPSKNDDHCRIQKGEEGSLKNHK